MDSTLLVNAAINALSSVVIKKTYKKIKSIVQNSERTELISNEEDLENHIIDEIRKISNWAYNDLFENPHIEHSDITSRYVHLDLLLTPRREQTNKELQSLKKRPLKEIILANKNNTVILGQPGSGKTTSIKYIVNSIFKNAEFLNNIYRIPIVIRLRELNNPIIYFNVPTENSLNLI